MLRELVYIENVTPTTLSWSVKIRVDEKMQPQQSKSGSTMYQRLIFSDDKGKRVAAVVFQKDIEMLKDTLQKNHTYIISKASVRRAIDTYRVIDNDYQWVLSSKTEIMPTHEIVRGDVTQETHLTPLCEVISSLGTHTWLDILVVVIGKMPPRTITFKGEEILLQDFGVIDQGFKPFVLTFWKDLIKNEAEQIITDGENFPVISISRISVTTYHAMLTGLTLRTNAASNILINPQIPAAKNLQQWEKDNHDELARIALDTTYMAGIDASNIAIMMKPNTVSEIMKSDLFKKFRVHGKGRIDNFNQCFYYKVCDRCGLSTVCDPDSSFHCHRCKEIRTSVPRAKITLTVHDLTGQVEAIAFNAPAEKILKNDSVTCLKKCLQDSVGYLQNLNMHMEKETHIFIINKNKDVRNDGDRIQFVVTDVLDEFEDSELQSNIESNRSKGKEKAIECDGLDDIHSEKHNTSILISPKVEKSNIAKRPYNTDINGPTNESEVSTFDRKLKK